MNQIENAMHAIVFFILLIAGSALAAYGIWLAQIDQILKLIFSALAFAAVLVILLVTFDRFDWDWWSSF
jgi:hypothetical protein